MPWRMLRSLLGRRTMSRTLTNAQMIDEQVAARGVQSERVLAAMRATDRALFVTPGLREEAYEDHPLPVGDDQTISQPYIVGTMTEMLDPQPHHRILEIGTGTGYQTAILSRLASEVWSIESSSTLSAAARDLLARLGISNAHVIHGDGNEGLPDRSPFDRIIVTAAPPAVPQALMDQLAVGGRMVIPVGTDWQALHLVERTAPEAWTDTPSIAVRFVPMTAGVR